MPGALRIGAGGTGSNSLCLLIFLLKTESGSEETRLLEICGSEVGSVSAPGVPSQPPTPP